MLVLTSKTEDGRPWLWGFWKEENNMASRPVLIEGDEEQFQEDLEKASVRQQERLESLEENRYMIVDEWDQWWFQAAAGEWS